MSRQRIIDLYRFIDWVLRLPAGLELQYTDAIFKIEEGLRMPYLSFVERRGEARGEARGIARLLRGQLEARFGSLSLDALDRLDSADTERLMAWGGRVFTASTVDEVFAEGQPPTGGSR